MTITFIESAWEEYLYWQQTDQVKVKRIQRSIQEIASDPFHGLEKLELLRARLAGLWSRRIDSEHRLIYRVQKSSLGVVQCRYHY